MFSTQGLKDLCLMITTEAIASSSRSPPTDCAGLVNIENNPAGCCQSAYQDKCYSSGCLEKIPSGPPTLRLISMIARSDKPVLLREEYADNNGPHISSPNPHLREGPRQGAFSTKAYPCVIN